jgi:hypothetical protein
MCTVRSADGNSARQCDRSAAGMGTTILDRFEPAGYLPAAAPATLARDVQ